MNIYQLDNQEIEKKFKTNLINGLSLEESELRLKKFGLNILPDIKKENLLIIFLRQFKNPLIYILLSSSIIMLFLNQFIDAFIIMIVLLFNAILGAFQEGKTRNVLESLKKLLKTEVVVIRDGKKFVIEDKYLVVGDLVILQQGEKIPADLRIIESYNLVIDEAILTGESVGIQKNFEVILDEKPIYEQKNIAFQGTYVLSGYGKGIVIAAGDETEIAKIGKITKEIDDVFPLQKEFHKLSNIILIILIIICLFLFFLGLIEQRPFFELIYIVITLFISVIPEGLPAVLTLVLVTGAFRMAKQNVLVKKLQAIEALGRVDIIAMDKTGTLTRNEMMVTKFFCDEKIFTVTGEGYSTSGKILYEDNEIKNIDENSTLYYLGLASNLLNRSEIKKINNKLYKIEGDPTNSAVYILSKKIDLNYESIKKEYDLVYDIPFDSLLRYQAAFYKNNSKIYLFVLGSPEIILKNSKNITDKAYEILDEFLEEGLRIVAVGMKIIEESDFEDYKNNIKDLTFLGLLGIQDAIREEVINYINEAKDAGIKLIIITGDHKKTALYVAKNVGIYNEGDLVYDGIEFDNLSEKEKEKVLENISVFSRATPQSKFEIVKLFHKKGKVVAMTGDGVNDAPSLVAADVGIAMGTIGTEVAKQASDIVLIDDSFGTMMNSIEQGRHIFYTLKRVILYFFATNLSEILVILFAFIINLPLPILPIQILWINLVTDGFLDMALTVEPLDKDTILNKWFKIKGNLINLDLFYRIIFMSIPMAIGSMIIFYNYYKLDILKARTLTLTTMAMFQWFNAWNCRSMYKSLFKIGFFTNKWIIITTLFVFVLHIFLIYNPFMQNLFSTVSISFVEWLLIFIISFSIIILEEIRKNLSFDYKQ